ncbi:MAG: hypothetical protein EBZ48_15435 [Proteobacteria bacterium]|nr:hypothetical protein [Pseudomonadota bacterium]
MQAGAFINATLSHVRIFRKFLSTPSEDPSSFDEMIFMSEGLRQYIDRCGFLGRGDRLFATALLGQPPEERGASEFADLFGLGGRAHQILCRLRSYLSLPFATEAVLSRQAADLSKHILAQVATAPPWIECQAELELFTGRAADPALNRQRYSALLGATYRLGGIPAITRVFGDIYNGTETLPPPPGACGVIAREHSGSWRTPAA